MFSREIFVFSATKAKYFLRVTTLLELYKTFSVVASNRASVKNQWSALFIFRVEDGKSINFSLQGTLPLSLLLKETVLLVTGSAS